jgi:hypothetical protein
VDDLRKKLPTWVASIRLYSSDAHLLDALKQQWLSQYETPDQKLDVSEPRQTKQIDRVFRTWNIIDTGELAALVHFPGSEVHCDRLERVTTKMKAPPEVMTGQGVAIGINE